jgi:sulfhydrogenase subunit alpha
MRPRDAVRVATLARVEGHGGITVRVADGRVTDVELRIFEPPRLFEAFLRGRAAAETPDLTSRICGICPVAHELSACSAIEAAAGVEVPENVRRLRRLLYCGEWIQSHALHVYLLHVPDYLGLEGVADLAAAHPDLVSRGLRLKRAGNRLMEAVGGRSIHPVNVRVGGFHRLPERSALLALRPVLDEALADAVATVRFVAGLDVPDLEHSQEYLALRPASGYPLESGDVVVTSGGSRFPVTDYSRYVHEEQVAHSSALHAKLDGGLPFVVGPLARYTLNADRLSGAAATAARDAGLGTVCRNPFRSIVVRAVEIVYSVEEALRILDSWDGAGPACVDVPFGRGQAGATGHGATEAPRGLLYHRYTVADGGTVTDAVIVPPTSQNLASIEGDLRAVAEAGADLPYDDLTRRCEFVVRNYDPCISCSAHFVTIDRTASVVVVGESRAPHPDPATRESIARDLRALGLEPGRALLLHASMRAMGWLCGGSVAVVQALLDVLGPDGTLVAPTFTSDNRDPSRWKDPAVPCEWWPTIRASMPAFDPAITPGQRMGAISERIRTWPGALRSDHPHVSFAAVGPLASRIVAGHELTCHLGERSPLARLEEVDALVLLLGVGWERCTCFHLAEYRQPSPPRRVYEGALLGPDGREWVTFEDVDLDDSGFGRLGAAFEAEDPSISTGLVGQAPSRLFRLKSAARAASELIH